MRGLRAGIEGNLHAVRAVWPHSAGWTVDAGLAAAEAALDEEDSQAEEMQQLGTNSLQMARHVGKLHFKTWSLG